VIDLDMVPNIPILSKHQPVVEGVVSCLNFDVVSEVQDVLVASGNSNVSVQNGVPPTLDWMVPSPSKQSIDAISGHVSPAPDKGSPDQLIILPSGIA
jgi:hypothetical protein